METKLKLNKLSKVERLYTRIELSKLSKDKQLDIKYKLVQEHEALKNEYIKINKNKINPNLKEMLDLAFKNNPLKNSVIGLQSYNQLFRSLLDKVQTQTHAPTSTTLQDVIDHVTKEHDKTRQAIYNENEILIGMLARTKSIANEINVSNVRLTKLIENSITINTNRFKISLKKFATLKPTNAKLAIEKLKEKFSLNLAQTEQIKSAVELMRDEQSAHDKNQKNHIDNLIRRFVRSLDATNTASYNANKNTKAVVRMQSENISQNTIVGLGVTSFMIALIGFITIIKKIKTKKKSK